MKKVSVSEFKGQLYVNIREYYMDKATGEEKPGAKGIALNAEHWKALKSVVRQIRWPNDGSMIFSVRKRLEDCYVC